MGKKDKLQGNKNAVTFKLAPRDIHDPNRTEENANKPVFQLVSYPLDERLTEEQRARRDKLINLFDDVDQGQYEPEEAVDQQALPDKEELLDQVQDKKGLWIHTLQKMKNQQKIKEMILQEGEYDEVDIEEREGDEDEEGEEYELEREEDDQKPKKFISLQDYKDKTAEEKAEELFNYDNIDYSKIKLNPNIKMKKLNQYGLPADDGYDYSQHIFDDKPTEGELIAVYDQVHKSTTVAKEDIDYKLEEMTPEQREVYEALLEAEEYEEIDDDFINQAMGEEPIIIDEKQEKKMKEEKELQKKQEQKKQVKFEEKKKDDDDFMEDEEFDEEEFKNAMQDYEDCEGENGDNGLNGKKIGHNELNDILDEHIEIMTDKEYSEKKNPISSNLPIELLEKIQKLQNKEVQKDQEKTDLDLKKKLIDGNKPDAKNIGRGEAYPYNYKQRQREALQVKRVDKCQVKQKQRELFGDDVVEKKFMEHLHPEDDIALQNYKAKMNNEEIEKKEQEELDRYFEKLVEPRQLDETIATKSFSMSTVHENLNIIEEYDENSKKKRSKKHRQPKNKTNKTINTEIKEEEGEEDEEGQENKENDLNSDEEQAKQDKINKDVSSIFLKRQKDEDKEERKLRKKLVKEFNKQRKEKNRLFKQGFTELSNDQNKRLQSQTQASTNLRGVKVQKM